MFFFFHVRLRTFNRLCFCIYTARKNAHYLSTPQLSTSFYLSIHFIPKICDLFWLHIFLEKKSTKNCHLQHHSVHLFKVCTTIRLYLPFFNINLNFWVPIYSLFNAQMYIHLKYQLQCGCKLEFNYLSSNKRAVSRPSSAALKKKNRQSLRQKQALTAHVCHTAPEPWQRHACRFRRRPCAYLSYY